MRHIILVVMIAIVMIGAVETRQAAPLPAPPAPGSPATYKPAQELLDALKTAKPSAAGMSVSRVAMTDQYQVNLIHRAKPAGAIAHRGNTELHYIVEGTATLVTGGTISKGEAPGGATIVGGVEQRVAKGDVVIVPENSPHWYSQIAGTLTYLEVRFVAPPR